MERDMSKGLYFNGAELEEYDDTRQEPNALTVEIIDDILYPFCHDGDRPGAVRRIPAALPTADEKDRRIAELESKIARAIECADMRELMAILEA